MADMFGACRQGYGGEASRAEQQGLHHWHLGLGSLGPWTWCERERGRNVVCQERQGPSPAEVAVPLPSDKAFTHADVDVYHACALCSTKTQCSACSSSHDRISLSGTLWPQEPSELAPGNTISSTKKLFLMHELRIPMLQHFEHRKGCTVNAF